MKKLVAILGLSVVALAVSAPALALGVVPRSTPPQPEKPSRPSVAAPEIDVSAGTKAIAALIAGLLLAAEGYRRRR
jgi:hypothetical protein